ncbi:MAG: alpha/beta fold hydrolase [Flavobacterium sp.]|uniref:alpha/beta fold hydrolase n=1 Tax=Flavobacterium sp. TaxID=239 RepID=UPI003BC98E26
MKQLIYLSMILISNLTSGQMSLTPSKFMQIDDYKINYTDHGSGKETLLFLHGFILSTASWDNIVKNLDTSKFRIICIDVFGFGFSDKPLNADYSIEKQAKIVNDFLINLNIDTITIISHSYGGVIALYLTFLSLKKENNICIKKQVLIDVPAFENSRPIFLKVLNNSFLSFISLKLIPANLLAKYILKSTFYDFEKAKRNHLNRYTFFLKMRHIDEAMVQMAKQILPDRIDDLMLSYSSINFPVLIIWGENDNLISLDFGKKLSHEIKNSAFEIIPKCGHVPHEECPSETFLIINKFLN